MTRSRRTTKAAASKEDDDVKHESGEEEKEEEEGGGKSTAKDKEKTGDAYNEVSEELDPEIAEQNEIIKNTDPQSDLEIALTESLKRRDEQIERLKGEVTKLKAFISKRKQTYKRKRKETGAPTRALSAYNIFVQDKFSRLAKENEQALRSTDSDHKLKRVPPASLVASTGNEWKELSAEEKSHYEER